MIQPNEKMMRTAIGAARESASRGDYGIGSVVARGDEVISIGDETLKSTNDPVNGHAELELIGGFLREEGMILFEDTK